MKWRLTGTPSQIAIAQGALNDIKFPWDRLNITWNPVLGWKDLNSGYYSGSEQPVSLDNRLKYGEHRHGGPVPKAQSDHEHHPHGPEHEGEPEPLNGVLEGRRFTYAVFYPGSGRIYVDYRLERYPDLARASVSAEVAHAVDEFLPLTDQQRRRIIECVDGPNSQLTWWERNSYSSEYWTLVGEMFMPIFTDTFSDIPFGDVSSFVINPRNCDPRELVEIMGIPRTDFVPTPVAPPPPPPPEPVIAPDEEIIPIPEPTPTPSVPETHTHEYRSYGKSKIVHRPTHYPNKTKFNSFHEEHIPNGYRPCKICRPH